MLNPICSLLLLGAAFANSNEGDYATSTRDIASLLQLEDKLIRYMRQYIQELQHNVNRMRMVQEEWKTRRGRMQADPASYVANPLISFPLMLRMHLDAKKWLELSRQDVRKGPLQQLVDQDLTGIKDMDLQDATNGLLRFQDVYSLDERDVANGKLYGKQYDSRLSAGDCLAVGTHLDDLKHSNQACKWLNISLEQYEEHLDPVYKILETGRFHIWEIMGKTLINLHDLKGSQAAFKKSLQYASQDDNTWLANHLLDNFAHISVHVENCRGRNLLPAKSFLRCRYFTKGSTFLRLAPFKFEQLSVEPFIGLYHDVISPAEQEDLIILTRSRLEDRGKLHNFVDAAVETNASGHVERLHQRIEDMTGLELGESEQLRVSNYGIGGQHFIHMDCQQPKEFVEPFDKEYLAATVLLYLTEVQIGGYASFPDLAFVFKPSRGSALVWHNTDNSGNCDIRSLQATCPVLLGTLSVASKWISGSGQWRRKPCRK